MPCNKQVKNTHRGVGIGNGQQSSNLPCTVQVNNHRDNKHRRVVQLAQQQAGWLMVTHVLSQARNALQKARGQHRTVTNTSIEDHTAGTAAGWLARDHARAEPSQICPAGRRHMTITVKNTNIEDHTAGTAAGWLARDHAHAEPGQKCPAESKGTTQDGDEHKP
jgi:hypothetical protein